MEEFNAQFTGVDSCFRARFKYDTHKQQLWIKKPKLFIPVGGKWVLYGGNFPEIMKNYEERNLYDISEGITENKIRLYPFDIHNLKPYYPHTNSAFVRELETLKVENEMLIRLVAQLKDIMTINSSIPESLSIIKKINDVMKSMQPSMVFKKNKV